MVDSLAPSTRMFRKNSKNFFAGFVTEVFLERVELIFPTFGSQKLLFELAPVYGIPCILSE